ncbi:MAG TPA: hypothetical protein VJS44_08390 [Pyrinomonadaceae bacterium]|nr:hypothetical protein [Pyrinomonadaceae bacterium]
MSTPALNAEALSPMKAAGINTIIQEVEKVKQARFAFHGWMPHPNFGKDTFAFNIPYPVLERLVPIPLRVFPAAVITRPKNAGFALLGVGNYDVPSTGSRTNVVQTQQTPEQSMTDLRTAYGDRGMVELTSLAAADDTEFVRSLLLFHAVMHPAISEQELDAGRRPADLLLEDFPNWLSGYAERAYQYALANGLSYGGQLYEVAPAHKTVENLIIEISASIEQARVAALDPSIGVLPRTREMLNMAKNRVAGGKNSPDSQDLWLMRQFPSFPMDTDVERAQNALQDAVREGAEMNAGSSGQIAALLERVVSKQEQTDQILIELLSDRKKGSKAT